jgi:hypothetical protein
VARQVFPRTTAASKGGRIFRSRTGAQPSTIPLVTAPPSLAPDLARRQRIVALLTAVFFALGWHLWLGDAHLNAAEEGYLWYGTWRTGLGELPLRDFQSYDPGRYWACAALGKLLGDGLLGLRRAESVFLGLGVFLGLLAARRCTQKSWPLVPIGILLGLWLFPRHKVFEGVLALAATWAGTRLVERPTRGAHLVAGACAGLAAVFGRNHGLYAAVGLALLAAASAWKRRDADWPRKSGALAGGVVLGYAPMLVLFLAAPGFWRGFVDSLLLLLRLGTNIESPWLWPWRVEVAGLGTQDALARVALSLVYLLPLVVLPLGVVQLLRARAEELPARALLVAASVLGALYLHHASVRSDPSHLAQSIQPTLLAAVALVAALGARRHALGVAAAVLVGVPAAFAGFEHNPATSHVGRASLVEAKLGDESLRMLPKHADYYARLQRVVGARLGADERIFFAPSRPSFYALFRRKSPSWWIYFFVPEASREEQEGIVADLAGVEWALIVDQAIAEREDLRFRNSYPLVWAHLQASYERVPTPELEPDHLLLRLRE